MSSIVIAGDTSGSVTLQAPAVSGSTILTLPATSGTVQTSGAGYTTNGVAFASSTSVLATGSALTFDGTNFGVGGAASQKFHVQNAGAVIGLLQNTASSADARYRIQNTAGSSDWGVDATGTYFQDNNSRPFLWFTGGSEQMRLNSTGLGIGTSSPSARFDVRRGDADGLIAEFHQSGGYGIDVGSSQSVAYLSSGYLQAFTFKTDSGSGQVERARIDSSGNLLVGTTSASGIITTSTSVNSQAGSIFTRNTNASAGSYSGLTVGNDISNNKAGYILTSSNQPLSGFFGPSSIYAYASSGLIAIVTETANPIIFGTSGSERARIDSSGNLYLGGTTQYNSAKFTISYSGSANNGLAFIDTVDQTGTGYLSFHNSAGTQIGSVTRVTTTNAVVYNTTSDYRLKTVTGAVTGQGARIDALKPVDYTWTEGGQQARGFLAHEFQAVYSNSVTGDKDAVDADGNPKYQSMQAATSEVIADLVAEIQSLRQRLSAANL